MNLLICTVEMLEDLSRRATELAAILPSAGLTHAALEPLAAEAERLAGRLAGLEEKLVAIGPVQR